VSDVDTDNTDRTDKTISRADEGWGSALGSDLLSARVPESGYRLVWVPALETVPAWEWGSVPDSESGSAPGSDLASEPVSEFPALVELVAPEFRSGLASLSAL
jgi:hypothetical protein